MVARHIIVLVGCSFDRAVVLVEDRHVTIVYSEDFV